MTEAILVYHTGQVKQNLERYAAVTFLSSILSVLTIVIWSPHCEPGDLARVAAAFEKGVSLLRSIAPGFLLGQHTLARLSGRIESVSQRLRKLNVSVAQTGASDEQQYTAAGNVTAGETMFSGSECDVILEMRYAEDFGQMAAQMALMPLMEMDGHDYTMG